MDSFIKHINRQELEAVLNIQTVLLQELQKYAFQEGFKQIMPILISPITDPLNHKVYPAEIYYEDKQLKLTASMIFHKQLTLMMPGVDKILIMAPNIRLELPEEKESDNHLLEFSQYDVEIKNSTIEDVMCYVENLYVYVFSEIEKQCAKDLQRLGRTLPTLSLPFPRHTTIGVPESEVDTYCDHISQNALQPSFITNFKREFYDKEDPSQPGTYRNFDMVYPEGYGEALSGAEREYEHQQIVYRMQELNMDCKPFENYLHIAEQGLLPRTAGCGIGIQRLLRYITGMNHISDVCLFDRSLTSKFIF